MIDICSVADCDRPVLYRGWCSPHYKRWRRHGDPMAGSTYYGEPQQFIEKAVNYTGNNCMLWPYAKTPTGYGLFTINGQQCYVHRLVLTLTTGDPPTDQMHAAHKPQECHNASCVTPAHLRWATPAENSWDRAADGTLLQGESHPNSKLTETEVIQILRSDRRGVDLANEFGVSQSLISMIRNRKIWTQIEVTT